MQNNRTTSDVIADQVRHHRTRLNLSREQLAAECARLGAPELTYAALVSIELGRRDKKTGKRRRDISVDELLVLGLALAVPPLLLVLPLGTEDTVPTVPAAEPRDPYTVWRWVTGTETPTLVGPIDGRHHADHRPIADTGPKWSAAWGAAAYPASLYPLFDRRRQAVFKAHRLVENAKADPAEGGRVPEFRRAYVEELSDLAHTINEMTRAGLTLPLCAPEWIRDMTELDMLDNPRALTTQEDN
ncbi:hypothetical protein AB8O64_19645 [Streptomyces sp. QH1-20]|uniref:hypothetical protein n=1 Tax=Streptomyces sp. QH1-20 TaxID=3240934 RepID=UPI003510E587